MTDTTWKACERAIAARVGGRRVGCTGKNTEDVAHAWLSLEVKSRATLPAWLLKAVAQARRNCPVNRLAVAILHQVGSRHDGDLVVLTLADFAAWFGGVAPDGRRLEGSGE